MPNESAQPLLSPNFSISISFVERLILGAMVFGILAAVVVAMTPMAHANLEFYRTAKYLPNIIHLLGGWGNILLKLKCDTVYCGLCEANITIGCNFLPDRTVTYYSLSQVNMNIRF